MANSLVRPGQRATNNNVPEAGTLRKHPVLMDYEAALERGDPRAKMASEILSGGSVEMVTRNMLRQIGLTPEDAFHRLGFR